MKHYEALGNKASCLKHWNISSVTHILLLQCNYVKMYRYYWLMFNATILQNPLKYLFSHSHISWIISYVILFWHNMNKLTLQYVYHNKLLSCVMNKWMRKRLILVPREYYRITHCDINNISSSVDWRSYWLVFNQTC